MSEQTVVNKYPCGSVPQLRFCFPLRALTPEEKVAFFAGLGLPSGVGFAPEIVLFDYFAPEKPEVTLTGSPPILIDGVGAYRVPMPIPLAVIGQWRYRGRGTDSGSNPVCATEYTVFRSF